MCIDGEKVDNLDRINEETIKFYASLYSKEKGDRPVIDNLFDLSLDSSEAEALENVLQRKKSKKLFLPWLMINR